MRYQIIREQQLNCDIHTAWEFFSSPENLSRITPPDMKFKIVGELPGKHIYPDMEITYTLSPLLHVPLKWITRITQVDFHKSFTDFQVKGPYSYWNHHHEFFTNEQGILMRDTVDYELPFGLIGQWVHAWVVKRKLEDLFNYRRMVIKKIFPHNKQAA